MPTHQPKRRSAAAPSRGTQAEQTRLPRPKHLAPELLERAAARRLASQWLAEETRALKLSLQQLAHRLRVHDSVVRRKLDPAEPDSVNLADMIMAARAMPRLCAGLARRLQVLLEERPVVHMTALQHVAHTTAECGDVARAIHEATLDGEITDAEWRRIDRELCEAIAALVEARRDLRAAQEGDS